MNEIGNNQIAGLRQTLQAKQARLQGLLDEVTKALEGLDLAEKHGKTGQKIGRSGNLAKQVHDLVEGLTGVFTVKDVLTAISFADPSLQPKQSTLSRVLTRMETDGKLAVVARGGGKRATVYSYKTEVAPMQSTARLNRLPQPSPPTNPLPRIRLRNDPTTIQAAEKGGRECF